MGQKSAWVTACEVGLDGGTEVGVGDGLGSGTVDALHSLVGYRLAAVD